MTFLPSFTLPPWQQTSELQPSKHPHELTTRTVSASASWQTCIVKLPTRKFRHLTIAHRFTIWPVSPKNWIWTCLDWQLWGLWNGWWRGNLPKIAATSPSLNAALGLFAIHWLGEQGLARSEPLGRTSFLLEVTCYKVICMVQTSWSWKQKYRSIPSEHVDNRAESCLCPTSFP